MDVYKLGVSKSKKRDTQKNTSIDSSNDKDQEKANKPNIEEEKKRKEGGGNNKHP